MRFDASMESLLNVGRSESFADLNNSALGSKFTPGELYLEISNRIRTNPSISISRSQPSRSRRGHPESPQLWRQR